MLLRDILTLCLMLAFGALAIFTWSFHRRCTALEARLVTLEVALSANSRDDDAQRIAIGKELTVLEIALFGHKPPPPTITTVEQWQRNRDRWFNTRLNALERWRLDMEAGK